MIDKYPDTVASPEALVQTLEPGEFTPDESELIEAIVAHLDNVQIDRESVVITGHSKLDSGDRMMTFALTLEQYVRLLEEGNMTPLQYAETGECEDVPDWNYTPAEELYSEAVYHDSYEDDVPTSSHSQAEHMYISVYDATKFHERFDAEYETINGKPVSDALIVTFDVSKWG